MKDITTQKLPLGWEWRKLGECANLINGRAYSQHELLDEGTPIIRIQNLNGGDRWYYSNLNLPKEKYCEQGDLLFAWSGSFGPYIWRGVKSIFHYHIWRVLPHDNFDKDYAFHLLGWITNRVKAASHGVAMLHMTKAGMENWKIPLPPLLEQRRIADILNKIDNLREKRRESIAQIEMLKQAIFIDLFGDPIHNNKCWPETTKLGDVADVVSGVAKGRKIKEKKTRSLPYLAVVNVQDKALNLTTVKEIEATEGEIERYLLKTNDLLLTEGGDPDKLGRGTLWNNEIPECIHQNHIFRVRLKNNEHILPQYLNWQVGSSRGKKYFLSSAKQTTGIASINMTQLREFPLLLPPIDLQTKFARSINNIDKHKAKLIDSQDKLNLLFASAQQGAFRGEI